MKIERIVTYPVAVPLRPEYYMFSALGTHEVSQYLILRTETDAGLEGAGEATVLPQWSGETIRTAKTLIDDLLAPLLIGKDPQDIVEISETMDLAVQDDWSIRASRLSKAKSVFITVKTNFGCVRFAMRSDSRTNWSSTPTVHGKR